MPPAPSTREIDELKQAIDANKPDRVRDLMTANPALHRAPLGYAQNGPLTWAAECRVPWEAPSPARLAIAEWMLQNGSDVHQGGDGPLMRAALRGERIPMMDLLLAHGADVRGLWNGNFPILFAPCESVDPVALAWLLDHGADPNCTPPGETTTALDYLIGSYARSPRLHECIELLLRHGGATRFNLPGVLEILRGRTHLLAQSLDADPSLLHRRFPTLDCGSTGARRLLLRGATLLHVAAEFGVPEAAQLLLERGAPVDSPAALQPDGTGGQSPLFHAASQFEDYGFEVARLLLAHGADLSLRAGLPGHYERPEETVEGTALEYAMLFPGGECRTVRLLREASSNGARSLLRS